MQNSGDFYAFLATFKNMETRLTKLEMLSMEQEDTIEALNREVLRQGLLIEALELKIELLSSQIESINKEELMATEVEDEAPPPHY
jgi:uncharacterized coiled-coil protein SlyX